MSKIKLFNSIVVIVLFAVVLSCNRKEENVTTPTVNVLIPQNNYTVPAVTFKATVHGIVTDRDGNKINGAEIKIGNKTTTTDINGAYRIENADFTGDFCYIKATKNEFLTASTTVHGKAGKIYAANLVLIYPDKKTKFKASEGASVTLQSGGKVELPAGGYVTANNESYTGDIVAAVRYINPEDDDFGDLIPGGDLRAYNANGEDMALYSFGMLNVELHDDKGNLLQLAAGNEATLTFPIAASQQSEATPTIPLWYFDEYKGVWIEEGEAKLQGNTYVGKVKHFTPWNCDKPVPPSILSMTIVDGNGDPINHAKVKIGQSNSLADNQGHLVSRVVSGTTLYIDVFDEFNDVIGVSVKTPFLEGNKEYDLGTIVADSKNLSNLVGIVKKCDGSPLNGFGYIDYGSIIKRFIITNSELEIPIPNNGQSGEIVIYDNAQTTYGTFPITFPTSKTTVDWGEKKICDKIEGKANISFVYERNDGKGKQYVSYVYDSPHNNALCMVDMQNGVDYRTNIHFSNININNGATNVFEHYFIIFINGAGEGGYPLTDNIVTERGAGKASFGFNNGQLAIQGTDMQVIIIQHPNASTEFIKGTFSGKAKVGSTGEEVIITNGQFVAQRK
jgi:protocatechuate 3,4-dioxygenase beta subunit